MRHDRTPNQRFQVWAEIRLSPTDYENVMVNSYSAKQTADHAARILVNRPGSFVERAWVEDKEIGAKTLDFDNFFTRTYGEL